MILCLQNNGLTTKYVGDLYFKCVVSEWDELLSLSYRNDLEAIVANLISFS